MTTRVQNTTAEELLRMQGDGLRYELIRGELKKIAPPGNEHGALALEWSVVNADSQRPVRYEGKILNTQFPDAQRAVFQNYE